MNGSLADLRAHRWILLLILFICACAALFKMAYVGLTPNGDYHSYIDTAQLFSGIPAPLFPQRILKPLAPLGIAVLAPFIGFPSAFIVETVFFYFALAIAFYFLAFEFLKNKRSACIATLFVILSYPIFRYGLDLYTETGAQFFYILSLLLMLLYLKAPSQKLLLVNSVAIGIGLLWKEYSVISGFAFVLLLLFESVNIRTKVLNLIQVGIISLLPSILVQIWVYSTYHYSYLAWYAVGGASGFKTQFTIGNLVKSIVALLGLAWLLVPLAIPEWKKLPVISRRFLILATGSSLIVFLWGFVSSRLFYVMAPPFVLLAVIGLMRLPRTVQTLAVFAVLLGNILWLLILTHTLHI